MTEILKNKILNGYKATKEDIFSLLEKDESTLYKCANEIREHFCGKKFDLCSIINAKSGKCSEDCKFCAQSAYYNTNAKEYPLADTDIILKEALYNEQSGIARFSAVTSGRKLNDDEINSLCNTYKTIKQKSKISLCVSAGFLSYEQFVMLKQAGCQRYHCNLETSRNYFKNICTTHSYEDKVNTIKLAQKAGLEVCSGCIIGMGETFEDRIDLFMELRDLNIKSVPVNILNPIKGTPFENMKQLSENEVCKTIAIARFILPDAFLRLAGGRGLFKDQGKSMIEAGANAAISGDMLTTSGISFKEDLKILKNLGFETGIL